VYGYRVTIGVDRHFDGKTLSRFDSEISVNSPVVCLIHLNDSVTSYCLMIKRLKVEDIYTSTRLAYVHLQNGNSAAVRTYPASRKPSG
jgi:hypothetical protein